MAARQPNGAGEFPPPRRPACLLAQQEAFERLHERLTAACASRRDLPGKLAAATVAAVEFARSEPALARLLVLDAVAADRALAAGVLGAHEALAAMLRDARSRLPAAGELPELTELALVGAVAALIGGALLGSDGLTLDELEPQLAELVLTPYLGAAEARRLALAG